MKKFFLSFLIISDFLSGATAQDTVRYGDPWYAFNPLPTLVSRLSPSSDLYRETYYSNEECRTYLGYKDNNYIIYGIAVVMDSFPTPDIGYFATLLRGVEWHHMDSTNVPFFIILDSIYQEDSIKTWADPLVKQCRFEYLLDYDSADGTYKSEVNNCYEFYFDSPFKLGNHSKSSTADTFFVGVYSQVHHGLSTADRIHITPLARVGNRITTPYLRINKHDGVANPEGYYEWPGMPIIMAGEHYFWGGIFPIIERRCSVPRGLTLEADSSSVHWSSDTDAELFQLSICNHMWTDPDDGTIFTTTATTQALPSMSPDSNYYIYLRKQCAFREDSVWSDWSEPLVVSSQQPDVGIDGISTPDFQFSISPNPTDGVFAVRHTATEGTLTVTDLQGREIQTIKQLHNQTITLDLGPLPQGTYIVTLSTPSGTASQTVIKN